MKYSLAFKESQVKKVLPPSSRSIKEISVEAGLIRQKKELYKGETPSEGQDVLQERS